MLRVGEARVEVEDGEIRNGFETVSLGRTLEVVVPTLVHIGDKQAPMFKLDTERQAKRSRQLRVMATCICETCDQLHLRDKDGHLATDYFKPYEGLRLTGDRLPSVLPHAFGLIMMMMGDAPKLWDEVQADPRAGLVVPAGTN
ncbi:hypothetical protein KBD20_02820 [Candidatus Saccharibacteria bacterium]|nr:hypothetical protein [Candidatus Saccharibacteria bacterium]